MKGRTKSVIDELVKRTKGERVFDENGRKVVKLQSSKVILWLDYHRSKDLPYSVIVSFAGLKMKKAYQTIEEQVAVAKNINKICDDLVDGFCEILEKSLNA
jgi:hypothetical protein